MITDELITDELISLKLFIQSLGSDSLDIIGGTYEGGLRLQQIPDEIAFCINDLIKTNKDFKNFLEVGAAGGGNIYLFNHFFQFKNIVIIDDNVYLKRIKQPNLRKKNLKNIKYIEIIGDSKAEKTIEDFKKLNMTFDLIFIDGDHSYSGVKGDANIYLSFLNHKGYAIFHDTMACKGVKKFFEEIKEDKRFEFIKEYISAEYKPLGIGVFQRR